MATSTPLTRERDLVLATRALFDERGVMEAPIEEIARAVGIARGLVYRHFSSKDELYVLTVTAYLDELRGELEAAVPEGAAPHDALEALMRAYAGYCARYPAFLDCALRLMQRPGKDLNASISPSVWLRLGQGMAECIDHLARVLHAGVASGDFEVADVDFTASLLWTQVLGAMHMARVRVGVRRAAPQVPELFTIAVEDVVDACVSSARCLVRAPSP
jgi:AcrR family transcriptional regulator